MRLEDKSPEDIFLYTSNRNVLKHNKVTVLFETYRAIANSVNMISPEVNASIPIITIGFVLLHLSQIGIFLVSPCAIVELYSAEVEKIRLALVHLLVTERDENTRSTINLFLTYTEIRPFKYTIWRMIPINLGLPLGLLSMCTTYVIVLIQFSHLYE
ncbi:hypothetical protein EVAR_44661_1 [Eumeta japonica]|uniref:Uncharacterized protein n=1 Tax=Eumeta variegata TaxID=151549 RepID=A0A4C1XGE6_EUMVA|nr:hypothetical protein EVAR_44661_1 [Eumeta japonica]